VGELLDAVDRTVQVPDGRARDRILVRHPLQPFDPRNFTPAALAGATSWSFDDVALQGAEALAGERHAPGPFLDAPLPPAAGTVIELDDLIRFVERPVRAFLRQRLGVSVADYSDEIEDGLPVELDHLEQWGVGDRLLRARLTGVDARTAALAEIARGTLPPGVLGLPVIESVLPEVEDIVGAAEALLGTATNLGSVDVRVPLADGRMVSGTVPGIGGDHQRVIAYSRVNPRQRLAAWVRLLVLSAAYPERGFTVATVGRGRKRGRRVTLARLAPLDRATAHEALEELIALYDEGLREPLPIYSDTTAAYVEAVANDGKPRKAGADKWESGRFDGEGRDPEHVLVLGGEPSFEAVLADGRFAALAHRLWDRLLAHEHLEDR
jgi:exodeoxyribonuclease V gamma subunit